MTLDYIDYKKQVRGYIQVDFYLGYETGDKKFLKISSGKPKNLDN